MTKIVSQNWDERGIWRDGVQLFNVTERTFGDVLWTLCANETGSDLCEIGRAEREMWLMERR